jgi:hypothetical protein
VVPLQAEGAVVVVMVTEVVVTVVVVGIGRVVLVATSVMH